VRVDTKVVQRRGEVALNGLMWCLHNRVPEHISCAAFARKLGDDLGCGSPTQQQRCTECCEIFLQGAQRLCQPPARRATDGPRARFSRGVVEDVETGQRPAGAGGCMQSGVIGKTEVVAKPDNAGSVGSIGHQDVNSSEACWVHCKY
jgi:hypothetical protein